METSEKGWDKMNQMACGIIRSCLTQDIKYHVMTKISVKNIWEILKCKYLTKSTKNRLHLKRRLYHFQLKNKISIDKHMNNYTKLIADLANVDEVSKGEALIPLSSLPDEEYETFILILINDKSSLNYIDVSATLVNHKVRRKYKVSSFSSIIAEALTARGIGPIVGRAREILVGPRLVIANWKRTSVISVRKKDIERLIVQGSKRRRDQNQKQTSHEQMMILTLTLQCYLSITSSVFYSEVLE